MKSNSETLAKEQNERKDVCSWGSAFASPACPSPHTFPKDLSSPPPSPCVPSSMPSLPEGLEGRGQRACGLRWCHQDNTDVSVVDTRLTDHLCIRLTAGRVTRQRTLCRDRDEQCWKQGKVLAPGSCACNKVLWAWSWNLALWSCACQSWRQMLNAHLRFNSIPCSCSSGSAGWYLQFQSRWDPKPLITDLHVDWVTLAEYRCNGCPLAERMHPERRQKCQTKKTALRCTCEGRCRQQGARLEL